MQRRVDTFYKLEGLSNALFGRLRQTGGKTNNTAKIESGTSQKAEGDSKAGVPKEPAPPEVTAPGTPGAQLLKSAETVFKGSLSAMDSFIPHSVIGEYINQDLADEPLDQVAPNLMNNVKQSGEVLKAAIEDPKVRKALGAAIEVYGEAVGEALDIAKPTIDELVDKFWVTIDNVGEKSARGATNAMIDTVSAAVAEIPVVGGLVDLFVAGGKWFNAIASGLIAPTIVANGDIVGKGIYMAREGVGLAEKYGTEIIGTSTELASAVDEAKRAMESAEGAMSGAETAVKTDASKVESAAASVGSKAESTVKNDAEAVVSTAEQGVSNVESAAGESIASVTATPPNSPAKGLSDAASKGKEAASAMMAKGMSQGADMLNQAKDSKYGKAAMATGEHGKQMAKTAMSTAKLGSAVADGNITGTLRHSAGLMGNTAKLGYTGVKAASAVKKAKQSSKGGYNNPFMVGGGDKAKSKKARKTKRRIAKSIRRFTRRR